MGFFLVMKAEIVRSIIIMRRYWFRTLTGMIIGYGMLMVLIAGFMYSQGDRQPPPDSPAPIAGPVDPGAPEGGGEEAGKGLLKFSDPAQATNYVLGFIIGMFAFGVVGLFSQGLQSMAHTGVLEQLCMSPHGLVTNFLARATVGSVTTIVSSGVMVWLVTMSVGGTLHFDAVPILVLLALTFFNLLGFGFMVGGLVLVFKQVGQLAILIRMGFFGLALFAREEMLEQGWGLAFIMHALPITDASICLKYVLIRDQGRVDDLYKSVFLHPSFPWLLVSCIVWTILGIVIFRIMEDWSRSKGTLGAY